MNTLINRRKSARYSLPLMVKTDEGGGSKEELINISAHGCCISTSINYDRDEHVLLHFDVPREYYESERPFCLNAKIAWKSSLENGFAQYGMFFPDGDSDFFQQEKRVFRNVIGTFGILDQPQ